MSELKRMWINQPSKFDALHHLHGTNVLAISDTPATKKVYFLSGDVVSQQVSCNALSDGWK
jgi:hypothetical protein